MRCFEQISVLANCKEASDILAVFACETHLDSLRGANLGTLANFLAD
jgi:hypothetical protein